jgi:hypothetical protein
MSAVITQSELPPELDPPDNPPEESVEETDDPKAPYGFNEDGTPKAPYGYKKNGEPARRRGRAKGSTGTSGGSSRGLASLREPLIQRLVEYVGGPIMMVSPIGAAVWEERVEATADSILVLAARSPRWRKWVERLIAGSAGGDLGLTFVGVATGILVDAERVSPEGRLQHFFGIDRIYEELYGAYTQARDDTTNARGLFAEVS